jgi:uncharacterized repeat protein (TIGR03803 family)
MLAGCGHALTSSLIPASPEGTRTLPLAGSGYKTIFSFDGKDGAGPDAELIDVKGTFYGVTDGGGTTDAGTFFKISPSGTEKTLYSFGSVAGDGTYPQFGPLVEIGGTFYGTTYFGGKSNFGTVFKITPAGSEKVLYSFKGGKDGRGPEAGLTVVKGVLYGTTTLGGTGTCASNEGCGTVYKVTTSGDETVLHSFKNGNDGAGPEGGLTYINGALYGTTESFGQYLNGTIFKISLTGSEKVIHQLGASNPDGSAPTGNLTAVNGVLYGTTKYGGSYGFGSGTSGTVFRVTTSGSEKVIHSFGASGDGAYPYYATLANVNGVLYGATNEGGASADGTVFKVTTGGGESVLYSFKGGKDGSAPRAGPIASNGKLYGGASAGGASGDGTIYTISP